MWMYLLQKFSDLLELELKVAVSHHVGSGPKSCLHSPGSITFSVAQANPKLLILPL